MPESVIETQRLLIHDILSEIPNVKKVYYQPPSSKKLEYPCIIYTLNSFRTKYSSNGRYLTFPEYTVTLIDKNPTSEIQKSLMDLSGDIYIKFDRVFTADNMYHWTYSLTFTKKLW